MLHDVIDLIQNHRKKSLCPQMKFTLSKIILVLLLWGDTVLILNFLIPNFFNTVGGSGGLAPGLGFGLGKLRYRTGGPGGLPLG